MTVSKDPQVQAIIRGKGTTDSERYLARLADHTFLNLWSYPNLFKSGGKELTDLLVICGQHVLIFSDKGIAWPGAEDLNLAWSRWFRRAISKSVDQIRGAERWINQHPDRIFLDAKASQPLPLQLPPRECRKIHGIAVARGAGDACRHHFKGGSGSLLVRPSLRGEDHAAAGKMIPFAVGDVDPDGPFVHVFDDATIQIVMRELDTISDFAAYLDKKEQLVRSGRFVGADGEEDLVAYYMTHMNSNDEHDFTKGDGSDWKAGEQFTIRPGTYGDMLSHGQYIAKKDADEVSYVWDRLITAFTDNMMEGTTIVPDGGPFQLASYEEAVRHMALVPRLYRRHLGAQVLDALDQGRSHDRFTRTMMPGRTEAERETAFFLMTVKVPAIELARGYEQYRDVRRRLLEVYALALLRKYPAVKRVVGVATEPRADAGSKRGSSEDLIMAGQVTWTDELVRALEERQQLFNIASKGNVREYAMGGDEFPAAEAPGRTNRESALRSAIRQVLNAPRSRDRM
jgi:hypothetical protein